MKLRERYDALYKANLRPGDPDCWSYPGEGWYPIVERLVTSLGAGTSGAPRVRQIKEKFGKLQVYTEGPLSEAQASAIETAREAAARTCESCGAPGEHRTVHGWYATLCEPCAAQRAARR